MYGIKAYQSVNLESAVNSATPHGLITMLIDECIKQLNLALIFMEDKKPIEKGNAIGKAIRIIQEGLLGSLDVELGGETAEQLAGLYQIVTQQLVLASAKKDVSLLTDCAKIMTDLRETWIEMGKQVETTSGSRRIEA